MANADQLPMGGISSARPAPQPVVHDDGRASFRLEAPDARSVEVVPMGDDNGMGPGPYPMARNGQGDWTLELGSVRPGFHYFLYRVDGSARLDPYGEVYFGWNRLCHGLEVPDPQHDFYWPRAIAHGQVCEHYYNSRLTGRVRRAVVYLPPGYTTGSDRYPVLYLQHGSGESERSWTWQGRAHLILDNLLAEGRCRPMLVVMDNGYAAPPGLADQSEVARGENLFEAVLVDEIIPSMHKHFRAIDDRRSRALAGLSMGAGQALRIGLGRLDLFASVGALSGGGRGFELQSSYDGLFADADRANRELERLWIGCGRQDRGYAGAEAMHIELEHAGVRHDWFACEGAHEWQVWRRCLHALAPRLFVAG